MANEVRILTTTFANPMYNPTLRHGIQSFRLFYASLPIVLQFADLGRKVGDQPHSIDIPAIGIRGITDPHLIRLLVSAAGIAQTPAAIQIPPPAKGETYIACGNCKNHTWYNTRDGFGHPAAAVCTSCGNVIRIMRIPVNQIGHA